MVQRRRRPGLLLEPVQALRVLSEFRRKHLDGNIPPEAGVPGLVYLPHTPSAQGGEDFIGPPSSPRMNRHPHPPTLGCPR